jgi:hypothetical protein
MRLNIGVSVICSRTSTSAFVVVTDISVVVIATVAVVVDIVGKLRVRGTVDIPRLMMVCVLLRSGVNVGASIPN